MVKTIVKWGKQKYEVDVDASAGLAALQAQLEALTSVPAARQKVLAKGRVLKEDADLERVKEGSKLMLMGSAEALRDGPSTKVVFEEDLTAEQKTQLVENALKSGLQNLGNTCYMNSTLQCLRAVPELGRELKRFATEEGAAAAELNAMLARVLGMLLISMDATSEPVVPAVFTEAFRRAYPQFAGRNNAGQYAQQDADEAFSQLLSSLSAAVKAPDGSSVVDRVFGGRMEVTTSCDEDGGEAPVTAVEPFRKLRCHIDVETNYLHAGIVKSLSEKLEKRSAALGRDAVFTRRSAIVELPENIITQFVRFHWKQKEQVKAKVMRRVKFPNRLDAMPFCADRLRRAIGHKRNRQMDEENAKLGLEPMAAAAAPADAGGDESKMDVDGAAAEDGRLTDAETVALSESLDHAGYYELYAVVTHKGRSADGGHYIGWSRQKGDRWQKFDDDQVTEVSTDDIMKLSGGGDWHMAYIVLYRLVRDADEAAAKAEKEGADTEMAAPATE